MTFPRMSAQYLPIKKSDLKRRQIPELDVIIVTGDAYVDHHSYGAALIGRVLEDAGFTVGIIAQPDWRRKDDFTKLGRPKLFFGVTAGNLDSMVANYTASKKPRRSDDYSPGGVGGYRPDRATILYTNRIRQAFKNIPIVLGGIEASMRRLAHYDWWSDRVRRSILLDSKADILIYGMGERQILEIARRLKGGEDIKRIDHIRGTVVARNDINKLNNYVEIPSFEEISSDNGKFNQAFKIIYLEADPIGGKTIVQRHGDRLIIQFPPALPQSIQELDKIYSLDYAQGWHPVYDREGGVPGFETVRFSVTSHRGCCGGCSFCSLYLHQGRIIQSRSIESIVEEVERLTARRDFKGTITDIGGPTANLYMAECGRWKDRGSCVDKNCLIPVKCKDLKLGYDSMLQVLRILRKLPKVKHIFIGSGVRYDLLVDSYSDEFLKELCAYHVSGRLKVAPEHSVDSVLALMNKPPFKVYERFVERYSKVNKLLKKKQYLVNYFIASHPGSRLRHALELSQHLFKKKIHPEQIQDFIPLPMTLSGCMYYTGKDPFTGKDIYVAKTYKDRRIQRALIQYKQPKNRRYLYQYSAENFLE